MILNDPALQLEVVLGAATNVPLPLVATVEYENALPTYAPVTQLNVTNGTAPAVLAFPPLPGSVGDVKWFNITNVANASVSVTVRINVGGTTTVYLTETLAVNEHLEYSQGNARVINANGQRLVTISGGGAPSGPAGGDLAGTYPNPTVAQSSTAFGLTGVITPTLAGGTTNNWNPTGLSGASVIRLTDQNARTITGLQGGTDGRIIVLEVRYVGSGGEGTTTLTAEDSGSTAANRFAFPSGGGSLTLDGAGVRPSAATFQYDGTSSRWRLIGMGTTLNQVAGVSEVSVFTTGGKASVSIGSPVTQAHGGTGIDTSGVTDGQFLIGRTSDHTLNLSTLTAGTGITITNGASSATIAATGGTQNIVSLFDHFADAGNVINGATDVYADTIPAAQLANNGECIFARYHLSFATTGGNRQVQTLFAGTAILDTTALPVSTTGEAWITLMIERESSSVVRCTVTMDDTSLATASFIVYTRITGLTLSNTQILKHTLTSSGLGGGSTNDMVMRNGKVYWMNHS